MRTTVLLISVVLAVLTACAGEPEEDVSDSLGESVPESLVQPVPQSDPAIETAIRAASPDYTRELIEVGGGQKARYLYARVDLNDDDIEEVIVYLLGSFFCGTGGCNLLILSEAEEGYRVVNSFPTSDLPLVAVRERSNGWNSLVLKVSGGGAPTEYVLHTFDGEKYNEKERLSAAMAPEGEAYLADDFAFEDGIVLEATGPAD